MAEIEVCDVCGSTDIKPFKCKLICQNCGTILRTCADLTAPGLWDSGASTNHVN